MRTIHQMRPNSSGIVSSRNSWGRVRPNQAMSFAPGHALHLIQARMASATPRGWVDAIVETADAASGALTLRTLDGAAHRLWNAGSAALEATPGTPVAVHTSYGVLAIGRTQYNVQVS